MIITASQLRRDIYRLLDQALESGVPVEVEHKGRRLQIVSVDAPRKLDKLVPNPDFIVGYPDDLVHLDWSHEWRPYL